ncbi:MAG: type II secretion system F family protein [Acidimicrobiia bacterium]|nr:type II secretion system F family protein [Acidimicrobiia bacterium]
MTGLLLGLGLSALGGVGLRRALVRRRSERNRVAVRACVAPVVDLIAVVVGAGGTVAEAVALIGRDGPEPARSAFAAVVGRQRTGQLLSDALGVISHELGSDFHPLASALIMAEQGGGPVGLLLQRLAEEAQQARDRAVADALGRLPVALLVPLLVCQLPALIIGSVIPLIIVATRGLGL